MKNFQKFYNMGMAVLVCGLLFSQIATFNSKTEVQKFDSGGGM